MFFLPKFVLKLAVLGLIFLAVFQGLHWGRHWYLKEQIEKWVESKDGKVSVNGLDITPFTTLDVSITFESISYKDGSVHVIVHEGVIKFPMDQLSSAHVSTGKALAYHNNRNTFFAKTIDANVVVRANAVDLKEVTLDQVIVASGPVSFIANRIEGEGVYTLNSKEVALEIKGDPLEIRTISKKDWHGVMGVFAKGNLDIRNPHQPKGVLQLKIKGIEGLLKALSEAKIIPSGQSNILGVAANFLGKSIGILSLPLNLSEGKIFLGPIQLR